MSGRHVIDKAGEKPLAWQRGNRTQQGNVDRDRRVRIEERFCLEVSLLYLKIMRQHGGIARKASNAAIGVVKYDEVKLTAASRKLSGNLTNSPE
jgi:hypothetical protein